MEIKTPLVYLITRKVRSDARFFAQADRITALRDGRYKYVTRPDKNVEEFYDIPNDHWEENNLIENEKYSNIIKSFKEKYKRTENEIMRFQANYLLNKLPKSLKQSSTSSNKNSNFWNSPTLLFG